MATKPNQLTTAQACQVFGISNMTLLSWRKGTAKMEPLPIVAKEAEQGRIRLNVNVVKQWARKHGVALDKAPEDVLTQADGQTQRKPGPKPRQLAAA